MIDEDGNNKNFIHLYYLGERKTGNQFYILKRFSRCFMVVFQEYMKSLNLNKVSQISHHGIEKQFLSGWCYCIFIKHILAIFLEKQSNFPFLIFQVFTITSSLCGVHKQSYFTHRSTISVIKGPHKFIAMPTKIKQMLL